MIKSIQLEYKNQEWFELSDKKITPQLILLFGSRIAIEKEGLNAINSLKEKYSNCRVVTVSSAGNIIDTEVSFDNLTATAIMFEKTRIEIQTFNTNTSKEVSLGNKIASSYDNKDLNLLLVYSTMNINAGELIDGINKGFDNKVFVSGGVAGDGTRFEKTIVGVDQDICDNCIVTIGLYSTNLTVAHGSKGGWSPFGPPRKVTKAINNILFEIDNLPVLDLYKEYLGPKSQDLPASGLLFPFAIIDDETGESIVRGIQGIDEEAKSIILYGNIEVNQTVRLMRANHTVLVDGAGESANDVISNMDFKKPELAILVSCVARVLALDQLVEDELEEVKDVFGNDTVICGFYSYSEFSPLKGTTSCSLHNQTMTITALSEK